MKYFLAKTDPKVYSIDDLEKDHKTVWNGVHNFQALKNIKEMKPDDRIFVYHSQGEPAIVGLAEVTSEPYPVENDIRKSWAIDVKFVKKFDTPVTLHAIKDTGKFQDWSLIKQSRLSVMPVPGNFIEWLKTDSLLT